MVILNEKEKNASPQTVCVTGITGFLGGHITKRLLLAGHRVHGTCRDPSNKEKLQYLLDLPNATENLTLFKANLLDEGSFDESVKGCDAVIHVASPFISNVSAKEAEEKLFIPAKNGTENVLKSVNKTESVKKVVLTSSVAAIYGDCTPKGETHVFTEEDWNNDCSASYLPYYHSKKIAEKKAWEMADAQSKWKLAAINPSLIVGRPLGGKTIPESVGVMKSIVDGTMSPWAPPMQIGIVDVNDVAQAHCIAMIDEDITGRFILSENTYSLFEQASWFEDTFKKAKLPTGEIPAWSKFIVKSLSPLLGIDKNQIESAFGRTLQFDNTRAKEMLGINFTHPSGAAKESVEWLIEEGHLKDLK